MLLFLLGGIPGKYHQQLLQALFKIFIGLKGYEDYRYELEFFNSSVLRRTVLNTQ